MLVVTSVSTYKEHLPIQAYASVSSAINLSRSKTFSPKAVWGGIVLLHASHDLNIQSRPLTSGSLVETISGLVVTGRSGRLTIAGVKTSG
jgi:hypothetical protein